MSKKLDWKKFLQNWDPIPDPGPSNPGGLKGPEEAPGRPIKSVKLELKDGTKVTVPSDMIARPQTTMFGEDLSLYGDAADIIRVHRDRPDLLNARKNNKSCDGDCEDCDSCPSDSGAQEEKP